MAGRWVPPAGTQVGSVLRVTAPAAPTELVDATAAAFLADALALVEGAPLVPIQVTGDGNCLAHSVSRAFCGEEQWYSLLRKNVQKELEGHREWYLSNCPHVTPETFDEETRAAGELGSYMDAGTGLHLLAMANVMKRPLVLMASLTYMHDTSRSSCGTYLPLRIDADDPNICKVPILVGWQSDTFVIGGAGHFICVSPTSAGPAVLPPNWLPPTFPTRLEASDPLMRKYVALERDGSVTIPNQYPESKMHRIVGDYSSLGNGGPELVKSGGWQELFDLKATLGMLYFTI
jgi:hypothetical protein